jgi:hypothetical protein
MAKSAEQRAIEALYPDAYKLAEDQSGALQSTTNLSPLFWDMSNQVEPASFDWAAWLATAGANPLEVGDGFWSGASNNPPDYWASPMSISPLFWDDQTIEDSKNLPQPVHNTPTEKPDFITDNGQNYFSVNDYNSVSSWKTPFNAATGVIDVMYNGVPSVYVPKSFAEKGYATGSAEYNYPKKGGYIPSGGNSAWFADRSFLDPDIYKFMKPAMLDESFVNAQEDRTPQISNRDGKKYQTEFRISDIPDYKNGYIIEKSAYDASAQKTGGKTYLRDLPRIPESIGQDANGKPAYVGYTKDDRGSSQRYDLLTVGVNGSPNYEFKWSKSPFNEYPELKWVDLGLRIFYPWYNLARAVGDYALNDGKLGDVALAVISMNVPNAEGVSAAQGTFLEIPQLASATAKIAQFYQAQGLTAAQAAAAARITFDTGVSYMAEGGSLTDAFTRAAATYVGREVAGEVLKFVGPIDADLSKITSATTQATTRALLLNEDVSQAAKRAFITTAVPLAVDGALKESGLKIPSDVRNAAVNLATQKALNPDADTSLILRRAVQSTLTDAVYEKVKGDAIKSGQINAGNTYVLYSIYKGIKEVIDGKDPSQVLVSGLVDMATSSANRELGNWSAKQEGWRDLSQKESATALYGDKVTPELYADKQDTTEVEAKQIARDILGREPTEFEYMQLIGLPEREASQNSDLSAIRYDESTFDSNELAQAYKNKYGVEPTKEFLESPEAFDMLGRSEAQGQNLLNEFYTKDKNWVTEDEAQQFWKDAGNTGGMPQSFMDELLMTSESGAKAMSETYRIRKEDLAATTFDGENFKDQTEAQNAAIKAGYNNYNWGGKSYYLMSPDQAEVLKKDIAEGKTSGPKPDAFFTSVPGMTLEQQLAAAGNPEEYAYQQGDTITVVGKRMEVPSYNDLEAWNAYKEEKQAAGGDNFQSFLTEQFSILEQAMKGAPEDSIANVMANAAMFGYGKMAQLTEAFSRTGEAMGIPQAQRGTNIAKQIQSWSNKLVDQGVQNAEAAVLANVAAVTKESIAAERGVSPSEISTAELYAQKTAALFKQIPNNPLGVSLFLAGEGIQEIPLLAVSGGVGSVFKNVIGKSVGLSAAVGTNVALNGAEGFGGNYGEVKQYLQKQGVPESQIEALAIKSGFEAMGASMLTSYIGDRALIKSFMGDLATDSFGKVIANNSMKEWFLGNLEGSLQNMSAQIGKYGSIKSEDEWLNAGIMEGFAQKGIAAGVLTADALSQVVAKDYDGKPVTFKQIIEGEKTFDPNTINKSFSYGTGVNLGDAIGYHSTFITNPDITPDEYFYTAQTFRENGMTDFTPQEIASIVSGSGEMSPQQISELALPYAQERVVTKEEAQQMMRDLGYENMTDDEALSFAGQIAEASALEKVQQYVDPRQVTRSEAEDFFKSIAGYTPTESDINYFVRQGKDINQEAVKGELDAYIDPRMVTEQEVRDAYAELGLSDPTQADIDKLIGQYEQEALAGRAQENLDTAQFNVTTAKQEETAKALADLDAKTTEQYDALNAAQKAAADALVAQGQTLQDAITAAKTETAGQIADVETRLTDAIAAAEAMGLSRDQAITAAVDSVAAELGTTKEALLTQLGTTEDALRTEFATGITGLETQMQEQYNALTAEQKALADALTAQGTTLADAIATAKSETAGQISELEAATKAQYNALTAEQKALADALTAQGTTLADAIAVAQEQTQTQIGELAADVQAKFDALTEEQKALATSLQQQGVDLNTAIATAQQQTQEQITNLGVEVDARINELMQQGQTYQQATQQAFAEVNAKNQELSGLIGTQGRAASQQDIDALNQMLGGQRSMDLAYDVTGDKQITQADIDFLTQVVGGVKTDWTAPQQSPWAATGLYGQIQANEQRRQQDLAAAEAQRQAEQQAAAERARQESVRGGLRTTALQGQQQLQALQQQLPQAIQMSQTTSTPIYGEMGPYLDLGSPLDFDFFKPSPEKQAGAKQAQPTKIAAGGYIDDLLAEGMTVDDLLNLLR